jgi:hypothetical protein
VKGKSQQDNWEVKRISARGLEIEFGGRRLSEIVAEKDVRPLPSSRADAAIFIPSAFDSTAFRRSAAIHCSEFLSSRFEGLSVASSVRSMPYSEAVATIKLLRDYGTLWGEEDVRSRVNDETFQTSFPSF